MISMVLFLLLPLKDFIRGKYDQVLH